MDNVIRATVAASRAEIEAESANLPESRALEILETDGLDGETLSIILLSATAVEGVRSLRLLLIALLTKDRRVRISHGETEIEVSSPADLESALAQLGASNP